MAIARGSLLLANTPPGPPASPSLLWKAGESGLVTGWGLTEEAGQPAATLLQVLLTTLPHSRAPGLNIL